MYLDESETRQGWHDHPGMVNLDTSHNGDKSERRQQKRRHAKTATTKSVTTGVKTVTVHKADSMSNQSLLALFRTTHLRFCSNFACQFTSMREASVPNFRKIGQVFFELQPSDKIEI